MSKRVLRLTLLVLVLPLAVLLGFAAGAVSAAPPADANDGLKLDTAAVEHLTAVAQRSEKYLSHNADGTLSLQLDDPNALGVTAKFLADYKAALENINAEIRAGRIARQADGSLKVAVDAGPAPAQSTDAPRLPAGAKLIENPTAEHMAAARDRVGGIGAVGAEGTDWSACNCYNSLYVNWTYSDAYWYRYHPYYYTWPAAMAAYVGYPHISVRLVYLFTYSYNHYYFNYCTYSWGTTWYIPWSYLCDHCSSGYYPVYFRRAYVYYYPYCNCYYRTYAWRGYYLWY